MKLHEIHWNSNELVMKYNEIVMTCYGIQWNSNEIQWNSNEILWNTMNSNWVCLVLCILVCLKTLNFQRWILWPDMIIFARSNTNSNPKHYENMVFTIVVFLLVKWLHSCTVEPFAEKTIKIEYKEVARIQCCTQVDSNINVKLKPVRTTSMHWNKCYKQ